MAKTPVKDVTPDVPLDQLVPFPKLEVLERGLQSVFGLPSAKIDLKDPRMVTHWCNTAIQGSQLSRYLDAGYQKVRPEMLADVDRVSFTVSPEGYVCRGERHAEILLYIPKDWHDKRQWEKARRNRDEMHPHVTKQKIVQAAGESLGGQAAEFLEGHIGPVGNVRDTYERIERTGEGE